MTRLARWSESSSSAPCFPVLILPGGSKDFITRLETQLLVINGGHRFVLLSTDQFEFYNTVFF